ncbi:MAG: hypothetical protein NW218_00655 [Saprospiraceae bacterium]|nr:hypothetical protein [Saprospiraceae bacterium]
MKQANTNLNTWMQQSAHAHTGVPFQYEAYSCVPMLTGDEDQSIIAFILSKDDEWMLVHENAKIAEHRSVWSQVRNAYQKQHVDQAEAPALPSETWFG